MSSLKAPGLSHYELRARAEAAIGLGLVIALNRNKPGAAVADITELQG